MDTNTLLIILVVVLLLGGEGDFYRRRWRIGRTGGPSAVHARADLVGPPADFLVQC